MKVKGIAYSDLKTELLTDPEVHALYMEEKKEEELEELLLNMRQRAGLNSSQVAKKMKISQPAISRLEKNVAKASISSLERYATACGLSLKISIA